MVLSICIKRWNTIICIYRIPEFCIVFIWVPHHRQIIINVQEVDACWFYWLPNDILEYSISVWCRITEVEIFI